MNKTSHFFLRLTRHYSAKTTTIPLSPLKSLVPEKPYRSRIDPQKLPPKTKIDADTIALLERLSLVDCANKQGIETLEAAIEFADQIQQVDTTGVEPLITVLEDIPLRLREDKVTDGNCRADILKNASLVEEDYFIAPPGNIVLESREDLLFENQEKSDNVKA
ncbi:glutamyl-tRNA(Gln) amidotransferase subunit C, mitochondrial [Anthonomus grandis grandis]|uniref:glutamyl-tRNA(Gln) amidotransferase subunit C, mitochondrial n=1 Tax=Anthonomus grandis grandis TaxID=2921223 RepID=UPI002165A4F6|nr:glutamyl-tRNA(Gln) amidotransferase subunit C, mitochondrial [Anthonomus grandis grandis]